MSLLLLLTCFVLAKILFTNALICPVYNLFHNETHTCEQISSLCTYVHTLSPHRRCLGIYQLKKNIIRIRQLAILDDYEGKYINRNECLLEIDRTGQNLLCRCNSNNCTFNWRIDRQILPRIEAVYQNWLISLTILGIVLVLFIGMICLWKRTTKEKHPGYCPSMTTDISNIEIEEFLASNSHTQSILHHGKSSIIYRTSTHEKNQIIVKLSHQHESFENEFQILRIIDHSNIIK